MKFFGMASLIAVMSIVVPAQWIKQTVNTTAGFRGLSVVDEKVIWASGTGGTVIRTMDGGKSWAVIQVPDAAKLDFRDIEAFDVNTAYVLSIGNGDSSRIYKTTDGGATWALQFRNTDEKAFYDALACWSRYDCIAMSDPVDAAFKLLITSSGGDSWYQISPPTHGGAPSAAADEAAFAASGTCLIVQGRTTVFLVSGGSDARVFRSDDRGTRWSAARTPIIKGTSGSGIFSIAMWDANNGVIVGGNYEKPNEANDNLALTVDGGETWTLRTGLTGYRSGVAYVDKKTIVAVGTNGSDITRDGGKTWKQLDKENYNSVQAKGKGAVWAVGPDGRVSRLKL